MFQKLYGYRSVCWSCGANISSEANDRCDLCGWYICNSCSACSKVACFGVIGGSPEERGYLRKKYRESNFSLQNMPITSWCNEQLSLKKKKERMEQERIHEELLKEEVVNEQKWAKLKSMPDILHKSWGEGKVTDSYIDGKLRYFIVHFKSTNEDKRFSFPGAFTQKYLSFKEELA